MALVDEAVSGAEWVASSPPLWDMRAIFRGLLQAVEMLHSQGIYGVSIFRTDLPQVLPPHYHDYHIGTCTRTHAVTCTHAHMHMLTHVFAHLFKPLVLPVLPPISNGNPTFSSCGGSC